MSISNINVAVVPCYPRGDNRTGELHLTKVHTEFPIVADVNGNKYIKELYFAVLIDAMQNPSFEVDANDVFDFNTNYRVRLRLSETVNDGAYDLDEFDTKAKFAKVRQKHGQYETGHLCHICFFENIPLPPKTENQSFVVKVLMKKLETEADAEQDWILQCIHRLDFFETEDNQIKIF